MTDDPMVQRESGLEPFVLHLTGPFRGVRQHLRAEGGAFAIGTDRAAAVRFPRGTFRSPDGVQATIREAEGGYALRPAVPGTVLLNGHLLPGEAKLTPNDVISLSEAGPSVRFLLLPHAELPYKSMGEALRDCIDCARHESATPLGRTIAFLRALPRDVMTQTAPAVRILIATLILLLTVAVAGLAALGIRLERRVTEGERRAVEIEAAIEETAEEIGDPELRASLEGFADELARRVDALEALSVAGRRVVGVAEPAVVFLQGEYGWIAPDGRPLRLVVGPDGSPRRGPRGVPLTSLEGDGPPFAAQFTGSAFLVREDGLLVTNRHVARPWTADEHAAGMLKRGFRPRLRLLAYAPGASTPVGTRFVSESRTSDLALVRAAGVAEGVTPIPLAEHSPQAGDEVVVLGYPAGIGALLARSGPAFLDSARAAHLDFWNVVEELATAGLIRPLASRGIVGQVSPSSVVYDAETTQGGSGGPVLSRAGELVAVTFGILPEFGGSNFGVPVQEVRRLLDAAPALAVPEPEMAGADVRTSDPAGSEAAARREGGASSKGAGPTPDEEPR